jgi:hypothetical protein
MKFRFLLIFSIKVVPIAMVCLLIGCCTIYRAPSMLARVSLTCRSYISALDTEQAGYGGYSYILFTHSPISQKDTARYIEVSKAYVNCLLPDTVYANRRLADPAELNMTFWPLITTVDPLSHRTTQTPQHQILVANYDYPRAQKIISNISDFPEGDGPFIVCNKKPLTWVKNDVPCRKLLVFDLTQVSNDSLPCIMRCFQKRVKNDPHVGSGCEYEEHSLLGFLKTDAPAIDWKSIIAINNLLPKF